MSLKSWLLRSPVLAQDPADPPYHHQSPWLPLSRPQVSGGHLPRTEPAQDHQEPEAQEGPVPGSTAHLAALLLCISCHGLRPLVPCRPCLLPTPEAHPGCPHLSTLALNPSAHAGCPSWLSIPVHTGSQSCCPYQLPTLVHTGSQSCCPHQPSPLAVHTCPPWLSILLPTLAIPQHGHPGCPSEAPPTPGTCRPPPVALLHWDQRSGLAWAGTPTELLIRASLGCK